MLTYLCETHFWTTDDDITIKHTDLGAFRYESKKSSGSVYMEGKREYVERRGGAWAAGGRRLRTRLRELNELLRAQRPLLCCWPRPGLLCLLFSTGTIAYICVDTRTADIVKILFDRYLVGKLLSTSVSEVLFTGSHILLTCADTQAILVSFNRPSLKGGAPEKLSNRDPKFQTVELVGGGPVWGGARAVGVSGSVGGGAVLLWRRASPSDLFPWSPHNDQANVHVYTLTGSQMSLLCCHRIEFDPLCVSFSTIHDDIIFSVEQKTSKKGGVVVEWRRLRVGREGCRAAGPGVRLAAPARATCSARSPCEERLLLACSDRSVLLHHAPHNITTTITAPFVGRVCSWWSGGVLVGGSGAQLQAWDSALAPARLAPPSEHAPPGTLLDLTSYFKKEPSLSHMVWSPQSQSVLGPQGQQGGQCAPPGDGLLLLLLHGGPLVCLRLYSTAMALEQGRAGAVRRGQEAGALARLRAMDWGTEGADCLALLHRLITTLFSAPLSQEREELAQAALGTFLAPAAPLPPVARRAHLAHLHDLCRRFLHLLLRYGRLEKALCLALDVGHQDLFMDVQYAARATGRLDLAAEAAQHAQDAASSCDSSCSRVSCSHCSSSSGSGSECEGAGALLDLYGAVPPAPAAPSSRRVPPPLPQLSTPRVHHKPAPLPDLTQYHFPDTAPEKSSRMDWSRLNLLNAAPIQDDPLLGYSPVYSMRPTATPMQSIREETLLRPDFLASTPPHSRAAPSLASSSSITRSELILNRYKREPIVAGRGDFFLGAGDSVGARLGERSGGSSRAGPQVAAPVVLTSKASNEGEPLVRTPEKNKVKFSDTVTVAVVPQEVPRKDRRALNRHGGAAGGTGAGLGVGAGAAPDWRRELADSLPLCHPNRDYLKDFSPNPLPNTENEEQEKSSKIKVVHFGVV